MSVVTERGAGGGGYRRLRPSLLVGIEILTIDARVVVASVDTYLRFAEATDRLDLYEKGGKDLPGLVQVITEGGAKGKTSGVLDAAAEKVNDILASSRELRGEEVRRRPVRQRAREREE